MNQQEPEPMAQPDAHFQHAFNNLPDWVLKASPATRGALKSAPLAVPQWHTTATGEQLLSLKATSAQHWTQRNKLESMLDKLQNARDFAKPLLSDALKSRFGLELDVETTFLRLYIPQTTPWFAIKTGAARTWTVSLLDAALHNFEDSETAVEAYESASTFITKPSSTGQFDTLPTIKPQMSIQDFTRLCRELDIGAQYEAHLKDNLGFTNPVAGAVLKSSVIATHKAALRSALQLAHVREDLPADAYRSILAIVEGQKNVMLGNWRLHANDLKVMSSVLTGIVIFAPRLDLKSQASRIVVYIPDDPEHPLKQYPDTLSFMADLTRKLRSPAYQTFFSRFVDHGQRGEFFADLNRRLSGVTWHEHTRGDPRPSWRDTPVDKPNLQFSLSPINSCLWIHLYQQQLNKILNDARTLAVSTARADQNARWAAWDAFSRVAQSILEVASFVAMPFVPFLGEVMLAYMAYQVLDETFEGIIDWAEGQKTAAFEQLMTLVETVVEVGTFAVGGAMAAGVFSRLLSRETVALLSPLKAVATPAGKTRYWKPDLTPYEQSVDLPTVAKPDHLGLYQLQGKTLLRLEGKLYSVKPDSETAQFQIEHPHRPDAYQPPLRHNRHGAWQSTLEQPLAWDRETVMRRLGHSVESFSHTEREQILQISGFHDNVLRETHVENQRPPSLLTDTIKRFKIDRDIQALVEQPLGDHPDLYQALNQRKSLFESRYRQLELTDDPHVQLVLGSAQGLPTDIAQELVSNTTGTELMQLENGRVPQRLKDVAVKAMEAVRGARAFEGFYLEGMDTADTHRLALHSLESLPGWPLGLRIEVREYSPEGTLRDSIGQEDATLVRTLVHADDGSYQVHEVSDVPVDFYQAVLQALPDSERTTLGFSLDDGLAFKQHIAEHAQNQPGLRSVFAKHPQRKPYYDPTTMRLPGGTDGYGRVDPNSPSLDDRVREVYPDLATQELQTLVTRMQQHPDGARVELSRLSRELARLHQDLHRWVNEAPTVHPETRLALTNLERQVEQHNRQLLAQEIQRSWRRQSEPDLDAPDIGPRYALRFNEPILGDLPTLTADFSHVSLLTLEGRRAEQGIHGFLKRFPHLRRLDLRRFSLTVLPDAIPKMANLDALVLNDCAIRFDALAWSKLSPLKKLVMLDLHRNPFDAVPHIDSFPELVHLDLSETGLIDIPGSALRHPKLDTLLLMNNGITELPHGFFDSSLYDKRGVHLSSNPLTDRARQLIKLHYLETTFDVGVNAPDADIQRVRALYPSKDIEQASEFVYDLPGTLEDGRIELTRLEAELARLSNDLAAWTADLPPLHPLTGEPFNAFQLFAEHANRDEFVRVLERCWRQESELDDFNDSLEPMYELVFDQPIHGELPSLSADFSHVSALELRSADGVTRVGRFLESFPNLKSLRLRDFDIADIPEAVFKMGQLRSLSLPDCRVSLSANSVNALAGMERLDYLDLSVNPLAHTPDLGQMTELATVLLSRTGITTIPKGLFSLTLLDWADLSDNAIADIPSEFMELPLEVAETINLRGNPFAEEALLRMISYFEKTGMDFGVEEVINRGEMQMSSAEGSEIDE